MVAVREGGGAMVARFGFDSAGRRSSLGMGPAGTVTSSADYEYDPVSRLETLTRELPGTASDQTLTFGYNSASQIVTRSNTNDSYASNATVLSQGYAINGLNQYTQVGSSGFQYDANGNLQTDGSTTLVYDSENRLVSASGFRNATLAYDPLGRLWQVSSAAGTTRFRYDGDRLIEEYNAAGTRLRAYVHGPGADEPLVRYELTGGPMRRFYHADHQGSIVAEVDEAGAVAVDGYDAWGVPNPGNQSRFQYTGQTWIPELGMYYYKARFYTPTIGRFIQVDPVGYDDQINLYAYVGNDPVNKADPNGQCTGSRIEGADGQCFGGGFISGTGHCAGQCSPAGFQNLQAAIRKEALGIARSHGVNINALRREASRMTSRQFADAVGSRGRWDFKNNARFQDIPVGPRERFGNFIFGFLARANGFSLTATIAGAGTYQNLRQGYSDSISRYIRCNIDSIASFAALPFVSPQLPGGSDIGTRTLVRNGFGFGDNPEDPEAILSGYDTR